MSSRIKNGYDQVIVKNLLTLSDKNYLDNGLCLYDSLKEHSDNFYLHYLALDEQTHKVLRELDLENLFVYSLIDLSIDPDLEILIHNNPSRPIDTSDGQSPFHWALASFFCNFLVDQYKIPHVMYIDSDILFYDSVKKIFDSIGEKSIGLITHKHMKLDKSIRNPGYYNVGVIYFRNNKIGKGCLKFWRDCCVSPNNRFSEIFGACGDQKYLELFDEFVDKDEIKVIDKDVGHGAPWSFVLFDFISPTRVVWKDPMHLVLEEDSLEQDIVFNHFSHFTIDRDTGTYSMDRNGEWGPRLGQHPGVKEVYDNYSIKLKETRERYNLS